MTATIVPSTAGAVTTRANSNPYYRRAVEAQPGYLDAVALRDKATQRQIGLNFPEVAYPDVPTSADDFDAYFDAFAAARAEEETRTRNAEALRVIIGTCERTIAAATDDTNTLLRAIAADFTEFLTRANAAVDNLDGASTPTEAITHNTTDAWRELTELRTEYDAIRAGQQLAMVGGYVNLDDYRSTHLSGDPLASDLILKDLDEVFPGWNERDTRYYMQGHPPPRQPWPQQPVEQLVWILRHATPWVPTIRQVDALRANRARRLNPTSDAEPTNMIVAPNTPIARIR